MEAATQQNLEAMKEKAQRALRNPLGVCFMRDHKELVELDKKAVEYNKALTEKFAAVRQEAMDASVAHSDVFKKYLADNKLLVGTEYENADLAKCEVLVNCDTVIIKEA